MPPRFLIDENLSPALARHLRGRLGYDAVHVNEIGLAGQPDAALLERAIAEDRVIVTGNGLDFRRLARRSGRHPGLAVLRDAVGRQRQVALGEALAGAIEAAGGATNRLVEIDAGANVTVTPLP